MALVLRRGRTVDRASPEPPPPAPAPAARSRRWLITLAVVGAVVIGGTAGAVAFDRATREHLLPGTVVGGVQVGGRSVDEARERLERVFVDPLHETVRLVAPDGSATTTPWKLGLRVDVDRVLGDTYERQQAMPLPERLLRRVAFDTSDRSVVPVVDDADLSRELNGVARELRRTVKDARLEVKDGKLDVIPHRTGQRVDVARAPDAIVAALEGGRRRVELPVILEKPEITTADFKQAIVVSTVDNTLDFYVDGKVRKHYGVSTGTGGYPTPKGQFRVIAKKKWPTWTNPNQPWSVDMPPFIGPGRNNPLGTRALYLNVSGIRIHGTPHSYSIGTNASHGCIRMHIKDSEELYELVDVGTPVLIVRA